MQLHTNNSNDSNQVIEARLLMHLGLACRLALLPNVMKCPTVRQRVSELEHYLATNQCTAGFNSKFMHCTGQLNEVVSLQFNLAKRVTVSRISQPAMPQIHVSDRSNSWSSKCQQLAGAHTDTLVAERVGNAHAQ
jgi:hypothetical protein